MNFFKGISTVISRFLLISIFPFVHLTVCHCQLTLGENSYTSSIPQGPVTEITDLVFLKRADNNRLIETDIPTSVKLSIHDVQVKSEGLESAISFGVTGRETMHWPKSEFVFQPFKSLGRPVSRLYGHSQGNVDAISVNSNYGVWVFTSIKHLSKANKPKAGESQYIGDLLVEFSRPLHNPVIHISGLGGTVEVEGILRGFSVELELVNTEAELIKLNGTEELFVSNQLIANSGKNMGSNCGSGAACGSILVKGEDLSSLSFKVWLRRDKRNDKYRGRWPLMRNMHTGDGFLVSFAIPDDGVLSGIIKDFETGKSAVSIDNKPLYINIIDPFNDEILASKSVEKDGSFRLTGFLKGGEYLVQLSTLKGSTGKRTVPSLLPDEFTTLEVSINEIPSRQIRENTIKWQVSDEKDARVIFHLGKKDLPEQAVQAATGEKLKTLEVNEPASISNINDLEINEVKDKLSAQAENTRTIDVKVPDNKNMGETTVTAETKAPDATKSYIKDGDNQCIIITGSFINESNTKLMRERLMRMGYKIYLGKGPFGYTRVGVSVPCQLAESTLIKIKSSVEPGSWILNEEDQLD